MRKNLDFISFFDWIGLVSVTHLGIDLFGPCLYPGTLASFRQQICCLPREMNLVLDGRRFDPGSCVHGIAKELVPRLLRFRDRQARRNNKAMRDTK
jgi:hypothetical protein